MRAAAYLLTYVKVLMQDFDLDYHSIGFLFRIRIIPVWYLPVVRSTMRLASTKLVVRNVFPIGGGHECRNSSGYPTYKLPQLPSIVLKLF